MIPLSRFSACQAKTERLHKALIAAASCHIAGNKSKHSLFAFSRLVYIVVIGLTARSLLHLPSFRNSRIHSVHSCRLQICSRTAFISQPAQKSRSYPWTRSCRRISSRLVWRRQSKWRCDGKLKSWFYTRSCIKARRRISWCFEVNLHFACARYRSSS